VLKVKADGLVDEVAWLKAESTKAQELAHQRRLEAESKEKGLHKRLQAPSTPCVVSPCYPFNE
jgi:hypothetical protein